MNERGAARLAGGLLAVSVGLAVSGTLIPVHVSGAVPVFLWLMLCFSGVGALVAARRPSNPIGWLLLAEGVLWQLNQLAGDLRLFATVTHPGLPGAAAAAWVYDVMWIPPAAALPLLFLLFPTGRLPSRRWRLALVALAAGTVLLGVAVGLRPGPFTSNPDIANPIGVEKLRPAIDSLEAAGNLLVALCFFAGLASLMVRYRHSDPTTRQQLKWLALAVSVVVTAWTAANVLEALGRVGEAGNLRSASLLLIPLACATAVLKYRLYDIDLVINKLVVYAGLAAFVAVLYVAVVVGVGALAGTAGEPNLALSVGATAAAAIAFDPARRALQRGASRAVYGRRASPYEALASMTRRVSAGYLATDVLERMARSIAEATGGRGEVWVTEADGLGCWACWPAPIEDESAPVPLTDPPSIAGRDATFGVRHGGEVLGALTVTKPSGEPMRPAEHRLLVDLAHSAALLLENVRLVEELRSSRQRLVAAQDTERRRVERDLHDGAQQRLLELSLTLRRAQREVAGDGAADAAGTLGDACQQLQQALAELRDLARGIHPAILTEQGLVAAVESMADRAAIPIVLDLTVGERLDPTVESTTYFLTSEAITNIVKHAGDARARITIKLETGALTVEVADDGTGGADPAGSGLRGLADRVAALDGHFQVTSEKGGGTLVRAVLPCE